MVRTIKNEPSHLVLQGYDSKIKNYLYKFFLAMISTSYYYFFKQKPQIQQLGASEANYYLI